jgi:Predicted membrane protein (DUF2335)
MQLWQGQFPPPEAIKQYEETLPGSFNRIIAMTERRLEAEIEAGKEGRAAQRGDVKRGHYLGSVITGAAMIGAGVCAFINQPWVAGAFLAVPVMSVSKALIDSVRTPQPKLPIPVAPPTPAPNPSAGTTTDAQAPPK